MPGESTTPISSIPLTSLFMIGTELFGEVQKIIGSSRVRALRVKLGNRTIKQLPVAPLTAAATVLLVLAAVVISNISIEVDHDPSGSEALS